MQQKFFPSSSDRVMFSRRSFLTFGAVSLFAYSRTLSATENGLLTRVPERSLSFLNLHTSETLKTVYWADGNYIPESLSQVNRLMRDHRSGEVCEIDCRLLDLLCELRMHMETTNHFEVISGYRSPATNSALRAHSTGVAENSLHTRGMAADIRLPKLSLASLRRAAMGMKAGGVGYYPASQFVHVDVGRVRFW
jgi:uncharacterized protein YcbK (DUF882 family)